MFLSLKPTESMKADGWVKKKNLELATILSDVVFLGAGAKNLATP
jgi:hypothetical protein